MVLTFGHVNDLLELSIEFWYGDLHLEPLTVLLEHIKLVIDSLSEHNNLS